MPIIVVGDVAIIAAILMAVLLAYALTTFVSGVQYVFPSFHIPGLGSIRSWMVSALKGAVGLTVKAMDSTLKIAATQILAPITFAEHILAVINTAFSEVIQTIHWLKVSAIPQVLSTATIRAENLYNQTVVTARADLAAAENYAGSLYNRAIAYAAAGIASVESDVHSLYNQSIAYAKAGITALQGDMTSLYNQSIAYAKAGIQALQNDMASLYNQSIAHADSVVNAARADAENLFNQAEVDARAAATAAASAALSHLEGIYATDIAPVWPRVAASVDGLIGTAAGDFTDAISGIRSIDWTKAGDIAGGLAATAALAGTLAKLADDCVIPNCRNLSGVGKDLQALFGLVEDGLLFAFLAELVNDPSAGITLVENTLGGIAHDAVTVGRAMVGI